MGAMPGMPLAASSAEPLRPQTPRAHAPEHVNTEQPIF